MFRTSNLQESQGQSGQSNFSDANSEVVCRSLGCSIDVQGNKYYNEDYLSFEVYILHRNHAAIKICRTSCKIFVYAWLGLICCYYI